MARLSLALPLLTLLAAAPTALAVNPPGSFSIKTLPTYTNQPSPLISWSASSGAKSYTLLIDATSAACASPVQQYSGLTTTSQQLSNLSDATYYVCVTAYNASPIAKAASNSGASFTLYTKPPVVFAGSPVTAGQAFVPNASVSSPLPVTTTWAKGTGPGSVTFDPSKSALNPTVSASINGNYTATLSARDAAGNAASSTLQFVWFVEPPPTAFTIKKPAAYTNQNAPTMSWSAANNTTSYNITFDATSAACANPVQSSSGITSTQYTATALPDAAYYVCVTAVGPTGLTKAATNSGLQFTVYTQPPVVFAGASLTASGTFTATATATSALPLSFKWSKVSGPSNITFDPSRSALDPEISASKDGAYVASLQATDVAGNSATSELQFIWNTAPGPFTIKPLAAITDQSSPLISWTAATNAATYTLVVDQTSAQCQNPVVTVTGITGTSQHTGTLADGSYFACVTANAATGATTAASNSGVAFSIYTKKPVVSAGPTVTSGVAFTPKATATSALPLTFTWIQTAGPGAISFSDPSVLTPTITANAAGTYTAKLTAVDSAGNAASSSLKFIWTGALPACSITGPSTATTGSPLTFTFTMTGSPTAAAFNGSPVAVSPATQSLQASAATTPGPEIFSGSVTDATGTSTCSITVTLTPAIPLSVSAPSIAYLNHAAPLGVTVSDSATYTASWTQLSGPTSGTLTFSSSTSPNPLISASAQGSYTANLSIVDSIGATSNSVVTIVWATTPPVLQAIADQYTGSPVSFDALAVSSIPIASYAWTQLSGPPGGTLEFSDAIGAYTSIAAIGTGLYLAQLSVTDDAGNVTSETFHFIWDPTVPVPTITAPAGNLAIGAPATFTISFNDTVTGFSSSGVILSQGAVQSLTGSGSSYSLIATPASAGPMTITVLADAAQNAVGTPNQQGSLSITVGGSSSGNGGGSTSGGGNTSTPSPAPSGSISYTTADFEACLANSPGNALATPVASLQTFAQSVAFIYSGASPLQTGVTQPPSTSEISVLRGRLMQIDGSPITGATITVLNHPELGSTTSGVCGDYTLAVNGSIGYTLSYQAGGYIPAQRNIVGTVQSYTWLDDVTLMEPDANIYPTSSSASTVVTSGLVNDDNGARQAILLVPAGTSVTSLDGQTTVATPTFRVTDMSIGSNQPAEAPGSLPLGTYSDFLADIGTVEIPEGQAGAFSQPVILYVVDYLSLQTGSSVPAYSYDTTRHIWAGDMPGLVINILSTFQGLQLDINGSGTAATPAQLAAAGISTSEQNIIATTPALLANGSHSFIRWVRSHGGPMLMPVVRVQ